MEYAVESDVESASQTSRYNIVNGDYKNPDFKWEWGFKVGLGYNSACDVWDVGIVWTRYRGKASSDDSTDSDDNKTLLPIWSNQATSMAPLFASGIDTNWRLDLDLVDLELGREFWVGRRLSLRPHVGLRIAYLKQDYTIDHKGGSWLAGNNSLLPPLPDGPPQDQNNEVDINNDFKSIGVRSGFDTVWNLGCGFAFTGNMAFSILYGRFSVDHDEDDTQATDPFSKTRIFEADESFRTSVKATDLALGFQWSTLFCDCAYGFTVGIAWEHHLFENQNQMWRVSKALADNMSTKYRSNNFNQQRGDLSTQGWTLTLVFDF